MATACQRLGNVVEIDVSDKDTRWYVLQTRSHQEKALARTLTASGIAHYLPLTKRPRYHSWSATAMTLARLSRR